MTDPTRMNAHKELYDDLFAKGLMSFANNPISGHELIPKAAPDRFFTGFEYTNSRNSVGVAVSLVLGDVDDNVESYIRKAVEVKRKMKLIGTIPDAHPFSSDEELRLLRAVLREKGMILAKDMLDEEGSIRTQFWRNIYEGKLSKLVDIDLVTVQFNVCLIDAIGHNESEIEFGGLKIPREKHSFEATSTC